MTRNKDLEIEAFNISNNFKNFKVDNIGNLYNLRVVSKKKYLENQKLKSDLDGWIIDDFSNETLIYLAFWNNEEESGFSYYVKEDVDNWLADGSWVESSEEFNPFLEVVQ